MILSSTAFENEGSIPQKYTCDGPDLSPPLYWDKVPAQAKSLALICDDPDAPMGVWVHWVYYNIPVTLKGLPEGIPADNLPEIGGSQECLTSEGVVRELNRLGYEKFMSFSGKNTVGRYEPLDIGIKLMSCTQLKYPLMVEIEKIASIEEEARQCEKQLYEISRKWNLMDRLIKEEPTHLLYESIYG